MIFNIQSTNAIDKLKWYIYLTNEFGAPSKENIDLFISNFSKIILNGNIKIDSPIEKQLNDLWLELESTGDKGVYSGGNNFYKKISKNKFRSTKEIEEFIRTYRTTDCYNEESLKDKDVESEDTQEDMARHKLDFNITPELVKLDDKGNKYIEIFKRSDEATLYSIEGKLYENNNVVINTGSLIAEIEDLNARELKIRDKEKVTHKQQYTKKEYTFTSPSGAGQFITGRSCNGWIEFKNIRNEVIDIYRVQDESVDESELNILNKVRNYSNIPLTSEYVTAYISSELIINIYPKQQKVLIHSTSIDKFKGIEFNNLEDVTLHYALHTLGLEIKDINDAAKQLYKKYLHSWKRAKDDFSIEYLYD